MLAVQHRPPAERFDPPCLRATWHAEATQPRDAFLRDARARLGDAGWSGAQVERLLRHGGLHLDGRPCGEGTLPGTIGAGTRVVAYGFVREPEPVPIAASLVLLDAEGVVAVNKPAWIAVQATRASQLLSLERALRALLACPSLVAVHRLDRETSGVLLFARHAEAASRLGRALARGEAEKRYAAVVSPPPERLAWSVGGFVGRALHPTRFRFAHFDEPGPMRRPSETHFRLRRVAEGPGGARRALVEARPVTGRTHQIRVHLAAGGTPIDGDPLYGPSGAEAAAGDTRARHGAERTQLHAESICIRLAPEAGAAPREIHAPWPEDFGRGLRP